MGATATSCVQLPLFPAQTGVPLPLYSVTYCARIRHYLCVLGV
jgi:hypothetical protein